jgi:hypothetical protein
MAAPLNSLHKKGAKFVWGQEQVALEDLKAAISRPPVLLMADFGEKFILQTDASGVALRAVLCSVSGKGKDAPTHYVRVSRAYTTGA